MVVYDSLVSSTQQTITSTSTSTMMMMMMKLPILPCPEKLELVLSTANFQPVKRFKNKDDV